MIATAKNHPLVAKNGKTTGTGSHLLPFFLLRYQTMSWFDHTERVGGTKRPNGARNAQMVQN
jgi:hypothetical protein